MTEGVVAIRREVGGLHIRPVRSDCAPMCNPACGCVRVCVSHHKDNLPLHPPFITILTNTPSLPELSHAHTFLEESFISLFGLLLVRALDALLPPPPPPCPALLSSSSSSSPLSFCRSHSLVFFFFFLFNLVCRLYLTEGPAPRSFTNHTVSILMLISLLQPLSLPFQILWHFPFLSATPNAAAAQ